jgi:hypothetical protein
MNKKRENIREKVKKRIIENDNPVGIVNNGIKYGNITKMEHENLMNIKAEILNKVDNVKSRGK